MVVRKESKLPGQGWQLRHDHLDDISDRVQQGDEKRHEHRADKAKFGLKAQHTRSM
jgi:hypothetical protein